MASGRTAAVEFALALVAWSLGIFGLLRLHWIEAHLVLPLTRAQGGLASGLLGTPALPVDVTLACSGADALALCLGAILAYPVSWRARLAGAGTGAALIVGLNTLRIGTLGRVAAWPSWFHALHVYVWPALLTLAIAGYVLGWMRLADRRTAAAAPSSAALRGAGRWQPGWQFAVLTTVFLVAFSAASPLYLESPVVFGIASFIARAAASVLGVAGVAAHASANVLWTPRGGFLVTQECISTPLIPVYLAAVCVHARSWWRLVPGVLAAAPLFIALGIVRLLVVALPEAVVASPLFVVHAFYQLVLGAVVVFLAARWRHGGRAAAGHTLAGVAAGLLLVYLFGPLYTRIVTYPIAAPLDDPQGAIALLPAYQIGLYLAVWVAGFVAVGWTRFVAGFGVLALTQTAGLVVLHALATQAGFVADVRDVRGWAVIAPVLIVAAVVNVARPHH